MSSGVEEMTNGGVGFDEICRHLPMKTEYEVIM